MLKKIRLYYHTIKFLKLIQVWYRIKYFIRHQLRKLTGHSYPIFISKVSCNLELEPGLARPKSLDIHTFTFLNQSHKFQSKIDWDFDRYGKLWAYNLNYFDFLHQKGMAGEEGLRYIQAFIEQIEENDEGLEPYPISLRGINWVRFLIKHKIKDKKIDASLYAQYQMLLDNLEYHLLGNHLLENGCSLLFGAYYFGDESLLNHARKILLEQLEEQILDDGGHFELSTMYQCILLERLLDCYNLVSNNEEVYEVPQLKGLIKDKVEQMGGWLKSICPEKSTLPLLNDAAANIAPEAYDLLDYANRLGITFSGTRLSESGYRVIRFECNFLLCDIGQIGPAYQPGHAHADTFSFVLYKNNVPLIIDPGVSTYEDNRQRHIERSTSFHNTVTVDGKNQSEVWAAFRVGKRARVYEKEEKESSSRQIISATHDGYNSLNVQHKRTWEVDTKKRTITILDELSGDTNKYQNKAYIHFSKTQSRFVNVKDTVVETPDMTLEFRNFQNIQVLGYECPDGFNNYVKAKKIIIEFDNNLETIINL